MKDLALATGMPQEVKRLPAGAPASARSAARRFHTSQEYLARKKGAPNGQTIATLFGLVRGFVISE